MGNNAFAIDADLECPEDKVKIIRTTNPDPICVFDTTAQRWVGMGIAEFFEKQIEEKLVEEPKEIEETMKSMQFINKFLILKFSFGLPLIFTDF